MAYLGMDNPDLFRQAVRAGADWWSTVDAELGGKPVPGATGLQPTGGAVTDTTVPGVRRKLTLQLAGGRDLYERLAPIGTTLKVTTHVRLTNRPVVDVPMGVFDVDDQDISEGAGVVSLTAPDKWARIQRARFVGPAPSYPGVTVVGQLTRMIRDALGPWEPVNFAYSRDALMTPQVWEKDRDKAMIDLAKQIGVWVYFDRHGVATIADIPTARAAPDWLVDASANGVLTELNRSRSRTDTGNVLVISSAHADGEKFPTFYIWDNDPTSPTFAGTNPPHAADASPFGIVPLYFDSIADNQLAALHAGRAILSRTVGLASSVSLGQVPNPAVDAFDALDVLPPGAWRTVVVGYQEAGDDDAGAFGVAPFGEAPFGGSGEGPGLPVLGRVSRGAVLERHIADTVTHPLKVGQGVVQQIQGRSTRYEELGGVS